jgi:hypothetical protein
MLVFQYLAIAGRRNRIHAALAAQGWDGNIAADKRSEGQGPMIRKTLDRDRQGRRA